jgi:hypothetical protein
VRKPTPPFDLGVELAHVDEPFELIVLTAALRVPDVEISLRAALRTIVVVGRLGLRCPSTAPLASRRPSKNGATSDEALV